MTQHVPFFRTSVDEDDIANVAAVLRTNFLTTGKVTAELEAGLAAYTGTAHAVGLTSCTAALHLCLVALGIGPGDEVLTTPLSFVATANAIVHTGARPVFVDVEPDTGNIDADQVEAALSPRTRVLLPVHLYGQLCDMRRLAAIAARHGLVIIEDAAHALESRRDGVAIGGLAKAACLSFYATKNITSGEGGAVLTNDPALYERLRRLRSHGMSAGAADRYTALYRHYDVPEAGWKYNMSDIQAALLIGQLRRVDALLELRTRAYQRYAAALRDLPGVRQPVVLPNSRHAHHLATIQVDPARRDDVLHGLQQRGIGVAVNFRPIHLMSYYRETFGHRPGQFPAAERIGASTVTLPLYPRIPPADQDAVIAAVKETLRESATPLGRT
ncbi:MAG: DegT/DnrJ/EryC1/StrS family aminotransferase [Actinobacteria bacterium]|nr:DegT/DnrJ/EryC1/StrS family aminotransferase [Actinomycetota bacterium]